jgi:hypothetical protein
VTESPTENSLRHTPTVLLGVGVVATLFCSCFTGRMIWEETFLTWHYGPQMLGFSLAHGGGAILFLAPILLSGWLLITIIVLAGALARRRKPSTITWAVFASAAIVIALLSVPEAFWQWAFIGKFAKSPRAAELMTYAVRRHQARLTIAYVNHGVPINATDHQGDTALSAAASSGDTTLVETLIARGADMNATNLYGDSPLGLALENHHADTAKVLQVHGAINAIGNPEQRDRATEIIVKRDIEKFHATEPR